MHSIGTIRGKKRVKPMRNYYRVSHLTWYIMYLLCISLRMLPFFITLCRSVSVKRTHVNSFYWHNEAVWKLNWKIIHHPWFCWPAVFDMYPGPRGFSWFPLHERAAKRVATRIPASWPFHAGKSQENPLGPGYSLWHLRSQNQNKLFSRQLSFHIPKQNI